MMSGTVDTSMMSQRRAGMDRRELMNLTIVLTSPPTESLNSRTTYRKDG